MSKYRHLMERLDALGLTVGLSQPDPIAPDLLRLAHDADYVEQVLACAVPPGIEREIGFPVDARVSRRAQLAAGGTLLAARLALAPWHRLQRRRRQPSRPARPRRGLLHLQRCRRGVPGLACRRARRQRARRRPRRAPGRRHGRDPRRRSRRLHLLDACREELSGAQDRLRPRHRPARRHWKTMPISRRWPAPLPACLRRRDWDIVFYNAGVDPHREDRLGRLSLSDDGLRRRERMVIEHFREAQHPALRRHRRRLFQQCACPCRAPRDPVRNGSRLRLTYLR